jgi:hypothetical protein
MYRVFESATTVLLGYERPFRPRVSGGEKRPKDRPRSVDGVNLEFFSRSRFRKSEKISITLMSVLSRTSTARERAVQCSLLQRRARVENTRTGGERFTSHVSMEEKAAEGNVAYFAEYATEELASKLVKYRDEDGRTLLHTAAAAGASSRGFASPRFLRSDAPIPRSPFPPPRLQRRQARPGRVLPRHRCRQMAGERQRRGARLFETSLARRETHAPNATIARRDETGAHSASEDAA